jgi:hypothetical protein
MMNMKKIILILFCLTLTAAVAWAARIFDYQPLLDSIQATVERAVGANVADQIPGGFSYSGLAAFKADVIECPKSISNVKQAADLLQAGLSLDFTNRIVDISRQTFLPGDDTVLEASLRDAKDTNKVMSVKITIFKRSSSRVILFPVFFAPFQGGVG